VYSCATVRRKPGVCSNRLALPIAETDNTVLEIVEGEVLGTRFIRELLALVDRGDVDDTARLEAEAARLRTEVDNLVNSIAMCVPADTVAPAIRERQREIAQLETKLRAPRRVPPNLERLRAALEQRAETWKADLRAEPAIARQVLRRLVGPIILWDADRPEYVRWKAAPTTELLDGLATLVSTSPTGFEPVFWP
jgi:hypothetical protein